MRVYQSIASFWLVAATSLLAGCASTAETTSAKSVAAQPLPSLSPAEACGVYVAAEDVRTHVYLINGLDPFGWAALDETAERIRDHGYPYTKFGELYDVFAFEHEIRKLHAEKPMTRFALIGFDAGTLVVRAMANDLLRDGIPVVMVGYIGGDFLTDSVSTRPPGVGPVVNVTGDGFLLTGWNLFWNGTDLTGAMNARLSGTMHFGLPTNPRTVSMLLAGLAEASSEPSSGLAPPPVVTAPGTVVVR